MTLPLPAPKRKDPQQRTPVPTLPPVARSRAALGLTAAAAAGRFALQHCGDCGAVQYPPRDACAACLSVDLAWRDTEPGAQVLAETRIHASPDPYFRERLPWRIGSVKLDAGPVAVCHLHGDVGRGDAVRMALKLDKAGQGVLIALPVKPTEAMEDDMALRALTAHPKHRRVLLSDMRAPEALPLAQALLQAGAARVFAGEAEGWRRWPGRAAFEALDGVEIVPLDVTDAASVARLAGQIGGKVDILVNTARFVRPGGVIGQDTVLAGEAMAVNVLGLMRLAQGFGPAMAARTEDGINSAVAFVTILSVHALAADPSYGAFAASQAAARALAQTLRAEFAPSGLRVLTVYTGPTEDAWHQPLPPPKVAPAALARAVVQALVEGIEESCCGDVARDLAARWKRDAKVLERELGERGMNLLAEMAAALASGAVRVVDLSHTLDPDFPVIVLPPEFGQCARFRMEEVSAYDHRGPAWKWHNLSMSEHTGTHFDAPIHWISGKDVPNGAVDAIDASAFVGPVVVIDCAAGAARDDDFALTPEAVEAHEAAHGAIPDGAWVLMRTDWSKRSGADYLNMAADGPHSPGPTPGAIRALLARGIRGFGTETVGTDAGQGMHFDPPYPAHSLLHGAGKFGLQCLKNLDRLPPTGALLIAAPLKIRGGTGSPLRVLALVPGAGR